jgi:DNA-binding transcriptional MerR regulator
MPVPYAISEAARRAGITVHQVRAYVNAGPLNPCATTPGGYFLFDEARVAHRSVAAAFGSRRAAIQQLEDLVSGVCATGVIEAR